MRRRLAPSPRHEPKKNASSRTRNAGARRRLHRTIGKSSAFDVAFSEPMPICRRSPVAALKKVRVPCLSARPTSERRLIANYGLRLIEIVLLWLHLCVREFDVGTRRDQLLWALYWLRIYAPESACVTHFQPSPTEKTYREAIKKFVGFIANLKLVR
jgi:hypothetical protein